MCIWWFYPLSYDFSIRGWNQYLSISQKPFDKPHKICILTALCLRSQQPFPLPWTQPGVCKPEVLKGNAELICKKDPWSRLDANFPFHNCHIEIPFRSHRREYLFLPAGSCRELECIPVNTQSSRNGRAFFSPHAAAAALAEAWVSAGAPASAQSALGGGGFLLLPITSFFIRGRTFFGRESPLLSMSGWQHPC